jgi:hypothetical protein
MGNDLHINKQTNIELLNSAGQRSIDQSRAEGNNTECVGKKRFNGRVLPMGDYRNVSWEMICI